MPPSVRQDEALRLEGDCDGAIASATRQLRIEHRPDSSSIDTLTNACLESGREADGIATLQDMCDSSSHRAAHAMLLLKSRIADNSERNSLCTIANDHTMQLIREGAGSSKIAKSVVATSRAGLTLHRSTINAVRDALAAEEDRPDWLSLQYLGVHPPKSTPVNLFVSGCPRSGTSALGRLLRLCSDVALYSERFKIGYGYCHQKFQGNVPIEGADMSIASHRAWGATLRRSVSARYVGDKRPLFTASWYITRHNYSPGTIRIIHIVRSAEDVAASHIQRCRKTITKADNGNRGWPRQNNELCAAHDLNTSNRNILDIADSNYSNAVLVVRYDRLFSDEAYALELFRWLDLPIDSQTHELVHSFIDNSRTIAQRTRILESSAKQRFDARLDRSLHDQVMSQCL